MQGWERLKAIKRQPTESLRLKLGKILSELDALDCPEYRITCVVPKALQDGRDSKGRPLYSKNLCRSGETETFFRRGEEEKWLKTAEEMNDEGRDIYITPIDERFYYLIIDDLDAVKLEKMRREVAPCIVVESSEGNYHSIVKVPKTGDAGEKECADALVKELNRQFDGDLNIAGSSHMFRVSGFQSKKPSRQGWRVRLAEVNPGAVCESTTRRLRAMMEEQERNRKKEPISEMKPKERTAARIAADLSPSSSELEKRYREEWDTTQGVFQRKGWKEDWSQIDFKVAKALLIEGYDQEDVTRAMVSASPDVARRHPRTEEWARKVVSDADRSIPAELRPSRYDGR